MKKRIKNSLLLFWGSISLVTLLSLFQNCSDINLKKLTPEDPPLTINEESGDPLVYECVENQDVPIGHDGLSLSNRMTLGYDYSGHRYPTHSLFFDLTDYNSIVRFPTTAANTVLNLTAPGPIEEGYGFPGSADMRTQINVEPGKFVSLKFRVPNDSSWHGIRGSLSFFPAHPTTTPENYIFTNAGVSWSISKCPGQFRNVVAAPPIRSVDCTNKAGENTYVESRIMWIIEDPNRPYQRPDTSNQDRCPLTPGETYYLNFIPVVDARVPGSLDPARINENYYFDLSDAPEDPHYPGYVPPFYSLRFMNHGLNRDNEYMSGH